VGPLLPEILGQPAAIGPKSPIFSRYLLVAPQQKSSVNTNRKSSKRFPMSLRRIVYVDPKSPHEVGSKTQNVQNLNNNLR